MGKMKDKFSKLLAIIVITSILTNVVMVSAIQLIGTPDDTDGVTLYTAGLSGGTVANPTGEPGGEPTDEVVEEAVLAGILEMIGDTSDEIIDFMAGPAEPYENGRDTTLSAVVEGLEEIDDFGYIDELDDPSSNFDAGIGGWVKLGNFGRIRADGITNNNTLGYDPGLTPEEQLNGNEIFIYEYAELSGINVSLITLNGFTFNFTISDRQINPTTENGADDTLITIDLDTLDGFDSVNDAVVEIWIQDDAISMEGEFWETEPPPALPIWGDSTLELDAVATLVSALAGDISGYKWNDLDGDGVKDAGEPVLDGWTINLSGDAVDSTITDLNGYYEFTDLVSGNYVISESLQSGWVQTHPSGSGVHNIALDPGENSTDNNFGNQRPVGSISGYKWNDLDGDGVWDPDEPALDGWTINLSGDAVDSTITGGDGSYIFEDLLAGSYAVSEVQKYGWTRTYPGGSGEHNIVLPPGGSSTNNNFGNQFVPPPPSVGGDAETLETKYTDYSEGFVAALLITLIAVLITRITKR
jgi:hypothetical protein